MSFPFDEDRAMASLTQATQDLTIRPASPVSRTSHPHLPSSLFVGNLFTWTPPFQVYMTLPGLPDRTVLQSDFAAAIWLALDIVHTQFNITPDIQRACRNLRIRSPPVFLTRPFHGGFNELHQIFASPEEALTALADAQRDGLDAISWVEEFVTACLALPSGLTGVAAVDQQLVAYYRSIGWPGFTDHSLANECRDLILHPTHAIRRAEEYDPVFPYFDDLTTDEPSLPQMEVDSPDVDSDFIFVGGV